MSLLGNLGFHNTSGTRTHVRFQFSTHAAAGGNVAPNSAFEAADLRIYRANDSAAFSATQRSSSNGITMTSPFDSLTGVHDVDIDLTDNTDAGFYSSGYFYSVVLAPDETVDGQTITGVVLCTFEIGVNPVNVLQVNSSASAATRLALGANAVLPGTVSNAVTSPTTTLIPADDITEATADHFIGRVIIFTSGALQYQATVITDYALVSGEGRFTVDALTEAPSDGDTLIVV